MVSEAVILAAGEGKRMKTGTNDYNLINTPKPLLEVGGKPIIAWKIEKLLSAGFRVILVINKTNREVFLEKLTDYPIEYCLQGEDTGTAAGLFAAKDAVKEHLFLVIMGDDLSILDIDEIKTSRTPTVFGFNVEDVSTYGFIVTNEKNEVTEIIEKQKTGKGLANTGIYVMPSEFFDIYPRIPKNEKNGEKYLTSAIKLLREKGIIFKIKTVSFWFGINTPQQLKEASDLLQESKRLK